MRKQFIINPRLQFKAFSFVLLGVLMASYTLFYLMDHHISLAIEYDMLSQADWAIIRSKIWHGSILVMLIVLGIIGMAQLFFFHGVIGPTYSVIKGLKRIKAGKYDEPFHMRGSDEWLLLIKEANDMRLSIKKHNDQQNEKINILLNELDQLIKSKQEKNIKDVKSRLKEIRSQVDRKAA